MKSEDHAVQNAQGWAETISALVAAYQCDYDRLEELREERAAIADDLHALMNEKTREDVDAHATELKLAERALVDWDNDYGDELRGLLEDATVDGEIFENVEDVCTRIQESPLSVQVREGWHNPGEAGELEDFEILLSTGGPALRIMGELDEHKQPHRAWLEYQDWGTPWTHHYVEGLSDALLTFCTQFYFGE